MGKRIIYHVDSPQSENLYYSLSINIPEGAMGDLLLLETSSLASFEQFVFAHKEEVLIKCFVADRLYAGFIGLFAVIFNTKPEDVGVMNKVLDNVYLSHSREEMNKLIYDHNQDILLYLVAEIKIELLAHGEDEVRVLVAKCNDITNAILQSQVILFPSPTYADDAIMSFCYKELNATFDFWLKSGEAFEAFRQLNRSYDSYALNKETQIKDWKSDAKELEVISFFGQEMGGLIEKVSYEYEALSEEEKKAFTNLWILLITVQYQGILPSSFYHAIKRIISVY